MLVQLCLPDWSDECDQAAGPAQVHNPGVRREAKFATAALQYYSQGFSLQETAGPVHAVLQDQPTEQYVFKLQPQQSRPAPA